MIDEAIKDVQPKWISVKNAVPENSQRVLIYAADTYPQISVGYYENRYWYDDTEQIPDGDWHSCITVTHWMPLPDKP